MRATEQARVGEDWCREAITPSIDNLAGKHLVLIGLGAIARDVARKAKAFDMHVTAVTRATDAAAHVDALRPRSELVAACAAADIVMMCASYDESTDKILNREAIAAMRPSAFFVNIARGRLVDESALIEALERRAIAGAGLDVAREEPLPPGHPFWHMDNVLLTPHIGGAGSAGIGDGVGSEIQRKSTPLDRRQAAPAGGDRTHGVSRAVQDSLGQGARARARLHRPAILRAAATMSSGVA